MKVLVLIALLSAALTPDSIAAVVVSKAGASHCKADAPDHAVRVVHTAAAQPAVKTEKASIAR